VLRTCTYNITPKQTVCFGVIALCMALRGITQQPSWLPNPHLLTCNAGMSLNSARTRASTMLCITHTAAVDQASCILLS
jgi:hypothetical protein